jgi:hypothetical protein
LLVEGHGVPLSLVVTGAHRHDVTQRYEEKESRFKELIRQRGLKIRDELVFAWYSPPFMPWFPLRNEVLIPVAR